MWLVVARLGGRNSLRLGRKYRLPHANPTIYFIKLLNIKNRGGMSSTFLLNLASHILSQNISVINTDWHSRYGYRLFLLESFVDLKRFNGTCYRASNWRYVGHTQGYKKQGNSFEYHGNPKEVFLYPLERNFRKQFGCDNPFLPTL